ncbi:hypothetical protein BD626DRAFT_506283 [Schizophyllum amplum]|uniref:Uncharacterized protein n=1 Tax=Schizophyllum amplum TaxID=97359 RepID=A0A550C5Q9_9AGAR|nr:hypothetical protein BD626DRAFT_506283 [Auriculariopsis ampla]
MPPRAAAPSNGRPYMLNGTSKAPPDAVEQELLRRLLASPEWVRIRATLHARLNEAGWVDDLYIRASSRTANSLTAVTVQDLIDVLGPHAHGDCRPVCVNIG